MLDALTAYEAERSVEVLKIQNAARNSTEWFENVERYTAFEAEQFAYSLLTRSQRISHENLRLRDTGYVGRRRDLDRADERHQRPSRATDVHAVHAARRDAAEPRRRLADGAVLVRRRHAGRLLPRAPRQPRARRRGPRLHRDDLRLRRRAHLAGLRRPVQATRTAPAWKRIVDYVHTRSAGEDRACSSATPAPRARRSSAGRRRTSRLPDGNWPLIAPSASPTGRATRCRAR